MKIIKVVVDKLPESARVCWAESSVWHDGTMRRHVRCVYTNSVSAMIARDFVTKRCPNCPLVEEAEEVQE